MNAFICVDASVAAKWVFVEEHSDRGLALYEDALRANDRIVVPPHLPIELTNAIRKRIARHLITHTEGQELLKGFLEMSIGILAPPGLYVQALDLAETFNRPTVYDTQYVALASIMGCDLWTADERLVNALGGSLPFVKLIRDYPG